jgi:hypothetical protein
MIRAALTLYFIALTAWVMTSAGRSERAWAIVYLAMTAGMVFELWMAQRLFAVAQAWQAVY